MKCVNAHTKRSVNAECKQHRRHTELEEERNKMVRSGSHIIHRIVHDSTSLGRPQTSNALKLSGPHEPLKIPSMAAQGTSEERRRGLSSADGAFAAFAKDAYRRAASLRRPVSVVTALTAGLEGVIPGSSAPGMDGQGVPYGGMQRRFQREASSSSMCPVDDNNGFLVLPGRDGRPLEGDWGGLLGGRYCFKRLIGVGTFAQIIEAEDMLSQTEPKKRVALKVTRAGMQGVGMQESQLLSFLAGSPGFCGANIVEAHAAFALGEHWSKPTLRPVCVVACPCRMFALLRFL